MLMVNGELLLSQSVRRRSSVRPSVRMSVRPHLIQMTSPPKPLDKIYQNLIEMIMHDPPNMYIVKTFKSTKVKASIFHGVYPYRYPLC